MASPDRFAHIFGLFDWNLILSNYLGLTIHLCGIKKKFLPHVSE